MRNLRHIIITTAFAVAIFTFWMACYPEALSFQEQNQMLLLTMRYFIERTSVAGGLADYVGEFITQMNYYPAAGASLLALLMAGMQLLTWALSKRIGGEGMPNTHYALSLVPAVMMTIYMGDENVMTGFAVAITMVMAAAIGYTYVKRFQYVVHAIAIPVLYWTAGPTVAIYIILAGIYDMRRCGIGGKSITRIAATIAYWMIVMGVLAQTLLVQYTPTDIAFGIDYHRLRQVVPAMQIIVEAAAALTPLVIAVLPATKEMVTMVAETLIVAICGTAGIKMSYDEDTYNSIENDYLVRREKWDDIVNKAEKKSPKMEMDYVCLNLALEMRGELLERMFEFDQCGVKGLLSPAKKDLLTCLPTAEEMFRLGMVNEAQKYFFDVQESIINCKKSGRCTKRLVETLMVNGRYKVAKKYIERLKKTMFYADWAKKAETYLNNEEMINNHPTWGRMRRLRYKKDFLGNYYEMDKMLGILYQTDKTNKMAYEYFVAQNLLLKNMQGIYSYLPWMGEQKYATTPLHIAEAVAMIWSQSHSNFDGMPIAISEQVKRDVVDFAKLYTQKDSQIEQDKWKKTYWYYCLLKNTTKASDGQTGATQMADTEQKR